jgi:hypothetical protein
MVFAISCQVNGFTIISNLLDKIQQQCYHKIFPDACLCACFQTVGLVLTCKRSCQAKKWIYPFWNEKFQGNATSKIKHNHSVRGVSDVECILDDVAIKIS